MPFSKDVFYSKYVSTHNGRLYGERNLQTIEKQFSAWDGLFLKLLPSNKKLKVADLGCGEGGLVYWLQKRGYEYAVGVDISEEQIGLGRGLGIKNLFHEDILSFLAKKEKMVDCFLLRDVLGHLSKEEIFLTLATIYGALTPGGEIIIKIPNAESPMSGRLRYGDFTHDVSFTGISMRQILLVAGFKDVRVYPIRPVVHGIKSGIRYFLWLCIELCLRFYRLVESGSGDGYYTQNIIVVAGK